MHKYRNGRTFNFDNEEIKNIKSILNKRDDI